MPNLSLRGRESSWRATTVLGCLFAVIFLVAIPAIAQEDEERLDDLKNERERVQLELAAQALEVDAATADFDVLAKALDDINALVDLQEARLAEAGQAVASAEAQVGVAELRSAEIQAEITELGESVAELAVASFTGENGENGEDLTAFLLSEDPTEAVRRRSLVEFQTGSLADSLDRMKALSAEAELVEEDRARAVASAIANRSEVESRRTQLAEAEAAQLEIVLAAETRLEARLAEAAFIEEIDAELAADIRRQEEAIARRIRQEAARKAAVEAARLAAQRPPPANRADMVNAEGFIVHKDVAGSVGEMIRAARSAGVILSGYGYRSSDRTAELRVVNGCPDINTSPPSSCRIPTARPGQSMHEFGKAMDFRSCWRGSPCFVWLANNAPSYGFFNLPGESWHWSTNAR